MLETDRVRLDVVLSSIRLTMQQAVHDLFEQRSVEFQAMIDQAISEYDLYLREKTQCVNSGLNARKKTGKS